ncbi:hypothetical protein U9J35_13865 [Rossellomorea aquimaris]|nr:hypothetical protein [Rossellomorea aquimaris]WRP05005.1 hypothetical protein U9J35_13865 [Rossellomorea aquimaris]
MELLRFIDRYLDLSTDLSFINRIFNIPTVLQKSTDPHQQNKDHQKGSNPF